MTKQNEEQHQGHLYSPFSKNIIEVYLHTALHAEYTFPMLRINGKLYLTLRIIHTVTNLPLNYDPKSEQRLQTAHAH